MRQKVKITVSLNYIYFLTLIKVGHLASAHM